MTNGIPILYTIDLECELCDCKLEGVLAHRAGGKYQVENENCGQCPHKTSKHKFVRQTKSKTEKSRGSET